ncbi:WD40 repeat-like protein [Byssothecium circinans]|uniref:WD40 repeat-like protein n=1 Tax=Byssothecium circinans TaxID=147558 RepID=A0A6A5TAC9_9PLEO|nr:WD40 repeat-like protein [Byssothecium circinans]
MNAQLFTHNVDNLGFNPKYPQPPAYIKVRTKYKKEKEFDHLFLAQELKSRCAKGEGANPSPQSGTAASHNPIWVVEFSKDGKFLAAGGQDKVVRVWAVLSTAEERRAHELVEAEKKASGGGSMHLSAPVFQQKPVREYVGHTSTILDLSWSKNDFLLSSSMDKTVRLWHLSRNENLCTFKHSDFVPSIQFHPQDDRFFLAGSLDAKLRLWSIPDKSVAYWTQVNDMITSVAFTPDGKACIAGTLGGLCMFYETEGLKFQSQIHVKSTRGQNAKGSKITGIQTKTWSTGRDKGDVKILVTSNDSRVRVYSLRDNSLEMKFRAHENACSQIRATFTDDTEHIICGSEDRKAYIWSTSTPEGEKKNQRPVEMFEAHSSITTCAVIAPVKTRQLLSASEDPIFDLCNPPPVTLISREQSVHGGSQPPTDGSASGGGSALPTPAESTFTKVAESPAYIARSAHTDGNIVVTADYTGSIKVFRQDCAFAKRMRLATDKSDTASVFSKRTGTGSKMGGLGRSGSIISKSAPRVRRDSTSTQPPNERIMSWQRDLGFSGGQFEGGGAGNVTPRRSVASMARSVSPEKKRSRISVVSDSGSSSLKLGER